MPGAPNRPPEAAAPPPAAAPAAGPQERHVLRRLAPCRVALRLDLWKGAPSKELVEPFTRAETLYESGDLVQAESALDRLSVRLAEPRWPTLPTPFRELRVSIPPPMPPHWNPEHALPPEEKEARKARRYAELQLSLAKASADWLRGQPVPSDDLPPAIQRAEAALQGAGATDAFWTEIDTVWAAIRERVAVPTTASSRVSPPPSAAPVADESGGEP